MRAPKTAARTSLINLSVEEENLAGIPFAVLERRVGRRPGKIEINGRKILPDGTELRVVWQVQGNNELGLPTEQDLDIFVALGMLTFQSNFAKTISFTGREIARILNIRSVHGRFYQRLKLAMDRFIPLRFRALSKSDSQEEVKWLNVFQEASFALDRTSGRCTGSVTWTDKLIQSMDSGFFRVLDASCYMGLDGITAKHLYRFLAVAFEKTDLVLIDARQLASEHLGILNPPKYFSRLLQTLEPAFDQLVRSEVLGAYHVVSTAEWRIALHRHPGYVPERKTLLIQARALSPELSRAHAQRLLEKGGLLPKQAQSYCMAAQTRRDFYFLERAGHVLEAMVQQEVLPHVAASLVRRALDQSGCDEGRELLDGCEMAVEICRQKRKSGQALKNPAGLLIKIARDAEARRRFVSQETEQSLKQRFRQRESAAMRQEDEAEERALIIEYEELQRRLAQECFRDLSESARQTVRREKAESLKQQEQFDRISPSMQQQQIDEAILGDLARKQAPPFEKWLLRRRAQQVLFPFAAPEEEGPARL